MRILIISLILVFWATLVGAVPTQIVGSGVTMNGGSIASGGTLLPSCTIEQDECEGTNAGSYSHASTPSRVYTASRIEYVGATGTICSGEVFVTNIGGTTESSTFSIWGEAAEEPNSADIRGTSTSQPHTTIVDDAWWTFELDAPVTTGDSLFLVMESTGVESISLKIASDCEASPDEDIYRSADGTNWTLESNTASLYFNFYSE